MPCQQWCVAAPMASDRVATINIWCNYRDRTDFSFPFPQNFPRFTIQRSCWKITYTYVLVRAQIGETVDAAVKHPIYIPASVREVSLAERVLSTFGDRRTRAEMVFKTVSSNFSLKQTRSVFISLYLFVPRYLRWSINSCDISDINETANGFDRFSSSRVRHNEAPFLSLSFGISTDCDTMSTYLRAQRMIEDCSFLRASFLLESRRSRVPEERWK